MDLSVLFSNINWVAVAASIIVSMLWSVIWYSKSIIGKQWMDAVGVKENEIEKAYVKRIMPVVLVVSIFGAFCQSLNFPDTLSELTKAAA
jgi:hypothetical protein